MEIVPAPALNLKKWSLWLAAAIPVFEGLLQLAKAFTDTAPLTPEQRVAVASVLGGLSVLAQFVKQNYPMTAAQKADRIESIAAQPVKGAADVTVDVQTIPVPSTPPKGA